MSNTAHTSDWLTPKQAAREIRTGPRTIYTAIRNGELRAAPVNGRGDYRIAASWLTDWMAKRAERVSVPA